MGHPGSKWVRKEKGIRKMNIREENGKKETAKQTSERKTKIKSDTEKDNEGRDTYSSEGVLIWRQKNGLAS